MLCGETGVKRTVAPQLTGKEYRVCERDGRERTGTERNEADMGGVERSKKGKPRGGSGAPVKSTARENAPRETRKKKTQPEELYTRYSQNYPHLENVSFWKLCSSGNGIIPQQQKNTR